MCSNISDPADYTGYQIALWRAIAKDMGWADSEWLLTCISNWTAMLEDLLDPNGLCTFAAAGNDTCSQLVLDCSTCSSSKAAAAAHVRYLWAPAVQHAASGT